MKNSDIPDPIFREAVDAIDTGNAAKLEQLLLQHSLLAHQRLEVPAEGYFAHPYLLWFVADNPIRHEKLPANIVDITGIIIQALQKHPGDDYQFQVNYTLGLVCTGRIPKECGVQIPLMEFLIKNGAQVKGSVLGPIGQRNFEAAEFLLNKGSDYNLATAVGLDKINDIENLMKEATASELYVALVVASFFGKPDIIARLIAAGVNVNSHGKPEDFGGFHSHASALHQAVYSGSLEAVKLLVEAGADLTAMDAAYSGTPLGWAMYMQEEEALAEEEKRKFMEIETYLKLHSS